MTPMKQKISVWTLSRRLMNIAHKKSHTSFNLMEPFRYIIRFTKEFCVYKHYIYILIFQSVGLQVDLGGKRSWHRKFTNEHNLCTKSKTHPLPYPSLLKINSLMSFKPCTLINVIHVYSRIFELFLKLKLTKAKWNSRDWL